MKSNKNIWRQAALAVLVSSAMCGSAMAADGISLPKAAIPDLQIPAATATATTASAEEAAKKANTPEDPNEVYSDKRLPNPYATAIWRVDVPDAAKLPAKFRTADATTTLNGITVPGTAMSGSAQPTATQWQTIAADLRTHTKGPLYDFDLRQETHLYVNGQPISRYGKRDWANVGQSNASIQQAESELVKTLPGQAITVNTLSKKKTVADSQSIQVNSPATEETVATKAGFHYVRITATDHIWPSPTAVDDFVNAVKNLPDDAWVHFHCEAGQGRTTTFMAMYEMMKHPELPFATILEHQKALNGLDEAAVNDVTGWKKPYAEQRLQMLSKFYRYVQQNHQTNFHTSWSTWLHPTIEPERNFDLFPDWVEPMFTLFNIFGDD